MSTPDDTVELGVPHQTHTRQRRLPSGLSPLKSLYLGAEPKVFVQSEIVRHLGDAREGLALSQVLYWFEDNPRMLERGIHEPRARYVDDQKYWWLTTHRQISLQTGLTISQVNRSLDRLRECGYIVTKSNYFLKLRQTQIRPDFGMAEFNVSHHGVTVYAAMVRMTQSANAALVLAQVVYWFEDGKNGYTRLRVYKNGKWWLAKSHDEFAGETGLTSRQVRAALDKLRNLGLVSTEVRVFKGVRTLHIDLRKEVFLRLWQGQDDDRVSTESMADEEIFGEE
jgi:DNA-binding transcriptional ArsR family regulator